MLNVEVMYGYEIFKATKRITYNVKTKLLMCAISLGTCELLNTSLQRHLNVYQGDVKN